MQTTEQNPYAPPVLAEGETYVGLIVSADGTRNHHIVLLPGDTEANWKDAMDWAATLGGDLPDRVESALLFATLKDEFPSEWHWTRETHASGSVYAWMQGFYSGIQSYGRKSDTYRARAVRRLPL